MLKSKTGSADISVFVTSLYTCFSFRGETSATQHGWLVEALIIDPNRNWTLRQLTFFARASSPRWLPDRVRLASRERMTRVLIPIPSYGFDPTESAVPCSALRRAGH